MKILIFENNLPKEFGKTQKYTFKFALSDTEKRIYNFNHIARKLTKDTNICKKNADNRIFWKMGNMYLVKRLFTFGLQRPTTGFIHVIEVANIPIDVFYNFQELPLDTIPFSAEQEMKKITLESNMLYYVPENVSYMLVARHICFFTFAIQIKDMLSIYKTHYNIISICDLPCTKPVDECQRGSYILPSTMIFNNFNNEKVDIFYEENTVEKEDVYEESTIEKEDFYKESTIEKENDVYNGINIKNENDFCDEINIKKENDFCEGITIKQELFF
ncbi:hypothetical protein NPIL_172981 [Nephila pilipes]|uniref:Uncharacterized protein n=1 Tax=Nephila pilipes TaxID=299642 RepID=A0A8X6TAY1_NEPPI|nr:hypothetical protein NPIL_172981 [Nephila pilipes]